MTTKRCLITDRISNKKILKNVCFSKNNYFLKNEKEIESVFVLN